MQITLNITEDSKVELVKDNCELVQGECCFTDFVFNFPETIKGYAIGEYTKTIEFAECKDIDTFINECVKFVDEIKDNKYELNEQCTAFKKIMVQIVLERVADGKKITWKTIPFTLEFVESVNANGHSAIQAQLLCLSEVRKEWQAFVKSNCLRMIYKAADVATAGAESEGDTIFYLGENTSIFTYGHYYRCVYSYGAYSWNDLTQDPSLEGVANGVREINKSRTVQFWIGEQKEAGDNPPQGEDAIMFIGDEGVFPLRRKLLWSGEVNIGVGKIDPNPTTLVFEHTDSLLNKRLEVRVRTYPYDDNDDYACDRYIQFGVCSSGGNITLNHDTRIRAQILKTDGTKEFVSPDIAPDSPYSFWYWLNFRRIVAGVYENELYMAANSVLCDTRYIGDANAPMETEVPRTCVTEVYEIVE